MQVSYILYMFIWNVVMYDMHPSGGNSENGLGCGPPVGHVNSILHASQVDKVGSLMKYSGPCARLGNDNNEHIGLRFSKV